MARRNAKDESNPGRVGGTAPELLDLALKVLDEARTIVSFMAWPRSHADWKPLVPPQLPELLRQKAIVFDELKKLDDMLPHLRARLNSLEKAADSHRGLFLSRPSLLGLGPNGEVAVPLDPVTHAKAELESATKQREAADSRRVRVEADLAEPALVEQEERGIKGWLDKHAAHFRRLHNDFLAAFESFENELAGLPGQERQCFGDWTGSSVCDVLRKIADDVREMLDGDRRARSLTLILHYAERLRDLVRIEVAGLIRITATRAPKGVRRPRASGLTAPSRLRPSAEAIDTAARHYLQAAINAASEADEPYVPERADIAIAVSKSLKYEIGIESLFGTTQRDGERVARHPSFMNLWRKVQSASRDAKRRHDADE